MLPEILNVQVEGGGDALVPLTPITTFRDVSACVRDPGDPLPLILEESPLGARVVAGWERPLELLRLWGNMREQVHYNASFTLSQHVRQESYYKPRRQVRRSRTPDSLTFDNIDPWELYELRDELKDLQEVVNSSDNSSKDAWETSQEGLETTPESTPRKGQRLEDHEVNKENDVNFSNTEDESHVLWTSFNSHTKDRRHKKKLRRNVMTEEMQNKHLQNLLQESKMAALYGSPFRRGSTSLRSFPTHKSGYEKSPLHLGERFLPSPYKRCKMAPGSLEEDKLKISKEFCHSNSLNNRLSSASPSSPRNKENIHSQLTLNNIKTSLNTRINSKSSHIQPNEEMERKINYPYDYRSTLENHLTLSPKSHQGKMSNFSPVKTDSVKRQMKLTCVSPTTHKNFLNLNAKAYEQASPTSFQEQKFSNVRSQKSQDPRIVSNSSRHYPNIIQTDQPSVGMLENRLSPKQSYSFLPKVLSPKQKHTHNQKVVVPSQPEVQFTNHNANKKVQSKFSLCQKSPPQTTSVGTFSHSCKLDSDAQRQVEISPHIAKSKRSQYKSPERESGSRSKFLRCTSPEETSSSCGKSSGSKSLEESSLMKGLRKKVPEGTSPMKTSILPFTDKKFAFRSSALPKHSPSKSRSSFTKSFLLQSPPKLSTVNNVSQNPTLNFGFGFSSSPSDGSTSTTSSSQSSKLHYFDRVRNNRAYTSNPTSPSSLSSGSEKISYIGHNTRRSRTQKRTDSVDHRRSYSDPLCEYLQDIPEASDSNRYSQQRRRRHSGGFPSNDAGMKDSQLHLQQIPDGGEVTLTELREMATRQQHQIETQQQLLVAREQRLKYLKQQEGRSAQVTLEAERLRRLRERVEAQEAKLRRLRALRGQVDSSLMNAASLSSDLEAMRHLFSEKEKELVDAAAKVEELTKQLEEVRAGRGTHAAHQNGGPNAPNHHLQVHHQELDKLRRELLYRNSVNREASSRVTNQRDALTSRKDEIARIDKRIAELQQRLYRKRLLNQQLASQISAATQAKQAQLKAVQLKAKREGKQDNSVDDIMTEEHRTMEDLVQFERGNQDPKYQTLPYNTKFSSGGRGPPEGPNSTSVGGTSMPNTQPPGSVVTRTVHSIPTHLPSKGLASAPNSGPPAGSTSSGSQPPPATSTAHISKASPSAPSSKANSTVQQQQQQLQQQLSQPSSQTSYSSKSSSGEESQPGSKVIATTQANQSGAANQDVRANLPPTSLSVSFSQKLNQGISSNGQSRSAPLPNVHHPQPVNKDVENIRAMGFPAGSSNISVSLTKSSSYNGAPPAEDDSPDQLPPGSKVKPILPPKPTPPSKPTPPPRQKGDPLAGSTESLNFTGVSRHNSQNRPHVFRYASQNVILSTYTQQQQQQDQKQSQLESKQVDQKAQHPPNVSAQQEQQQPVSQAQLQVSSHSSIQSYQQQPSKETLKSSGSSEGSEVKDPSNSKESGVDSQPEKVHISINRRIEMPPDFLFPEDATPPSDLLGRTGFSSESGFDAPDRTNHLADSFNALNNNNTNNNKTTSTTNNNSITGNNSSTNIMNVVNNFNNTNNNLSCGPNVSATVMEIERLQIGSDDHDKEASKENSKTSNQMQSNNINQNHNLNLNIRVEDYSDQTEERQDKDEPTDETQSSNSLVVVRRLKKGNLKNPNSSRAPRRVSFDPLALLLDASLEGELELVKRTATEVQNPSAANDEGITALHNAICAGHLDIVTFLVTFGCDVNAQDSDGWTPLHCAASCNNVAMVRFLVEHGACVLATTLSDHETAAEKCEQDEEGYDGCSQYLYSVQEKLGIMNGGVVYAVYDYEAQNEDELCLKCGDSLTIIRRGDEYEREWWWAAKGEKCGYVPRNLLGLYPRVKNIFKES